MPLSVKQRRMKNKVCPNRFKHLGMNLGAMVCQVFGRMHPAQIGRNWKFKKAELLDQNF